MTIYPADERRISEVERGRICEAVVPLPPDVHLQVGDTILFALCEPRPGQPACFVKGGDSVLVALTGVTVLETTDPETGQALVRITWEPLGKFVPPVPTSRRAAKSRGAQAGS